jgi:NAD(P)-dependent dehydrogenase (short-subunit alcohol dehydrogenase family)
MSSSGLFDLSGEIAVVIGATGVLGGAIALGLASAGAALAVVGRNVERGSDCAAKIEAAGGKGVFVPADATRPAELASAHRRIRDEFGTPTILVNAAGGNDPKVTVTPDRPFESIEVCDWQASFDLNLVGGVLLPCKEFGSAMARAGRGSIINIASVSAHVPSRGWSPTRLRRLPC